MIKLKHGPYSPSRLDTGLCPDSFYAQYVDPNRSKVKMENLPQARGSAVHEVLEIITKRFCTNPEAVFTEAEIRAWVLDAIRRHPAAMAETEEIFKMARLYIMKPPALITADAETELRLAIKWSDEKNDFVECDYDDPGAFARGRADIMVISDDTTFAIVYDHKTQPNFEEADTFQLGFYAWVISKIYPFLEEIRTVLHLSRYGAYSDAHIWTKEELKQVEDAVITRVMVLESLETWEPVAHSKCMYCPKLASCAKWADIVEVFPDGQVRSKLGSFEIFDTNKAVHAAELLTVIEEAAKGLKKNLKNYVEQTSAIAIPGKVYDFQAEEKINWDKVNKVQRQQVYGIFEKYDIDPKKYMSFNQTTTPFVWVAEGDNTAFVQELSLALPRKTSTTFEGRKV